MDGGRARRCNLMAIAQGDVARARGIRTTGEVAGRMCGVMRTTTIHDPIMAAFACMHGCTAYGLDQCFIRTRHNRVRINDFRRCFVIIILWSQVRKFSPASTGVMDCLLAVYAWCRTFPSPTIMHSVVRTIVAALIDACFSRHNHRFDFGEVDISVRWIKLSAKSIVLGRQLGDSYGRDDRVWDGECTAGQCMH